MKRICGSLFWTITIFYSQKNTWAAAAECQPAVDSESGASFNGVWVETQMSDTGSYPTDYSKCIYVIKQPDRQRTWLEADSWCEKSVPMGCQDSIHCKGRLVSLHNQRQTDVLLNQMPAEPNSYWIGLRQHCSSCEFEWSDYSPFDYTSWMEGEPNNWGEGEDCVTFTFTPGHTQFWNDDHCDKPFMFVCEAYDEEYHMIPDPWPTYGGCRDGWSQFAGGCYRIFGSKQATGNDAIEMKFHDANQHCNAVWAGANLAVFPNPYYQFFGTAMMDHQRKNVWIGILTTSNQDHIFHWIDNTKLTFTNWMPGEPNGHNTGEDTVEMIYYSHAGQDLAKAGQWNDLDPNRNLAFMCSHPVTQSESGVGPNPFNCPPGWWPFRSFCYKLNSNKLSFDDARTACQQDPNTDLVSITDDYEFSFVRALLYRTEDSTVGGNPIKPGAWIGLTVYKANSGDMIYKWVDNFPFAATYWDINQPDQNSIPNEPGMGCIFMNLPYGHWGIDGADNCQMRLPYVCKRNMDNVDPNDIEDNRGDPMDCPVGWTTMETSHHCYKPFPEKVDWFTAEGNCKKEYFNSGHLISIHSETKNTQAKSLFNTVDEGAMWIGAKRNEVNGFVWTDDSEFEYTKWGQGEPSGEWNGVPEDCATIERDSYWNDDTCAVDHHGYVCQIPRAMSNCISVAEPNMIPCGAGLSERQCALEKCCWDPTSVIKCFHPDGANTGSGSMTAGKAAGIVAGVAIAINIGAVVYFMVFAKK